MAVAIALVKNDLVVNVGSFDETVWDFQTWERFQAEFDELITVVDGRPWIGWMRGADGVFVAPAEEIIE